MIFWIPAVAGMTREGRDDIPVGELFFLKGDISILL